MLWKFAISELGRKSIFAIAIKSLEDSLFDVQIAQHACICCLENTDAVDRILDQMVGDQSIHTHYPLVIKLHPIPQQWRRWT